MLRALEILTEIRTKGRKPAAVMVDVGTDEQRRWWEDGAKLVTIAVPDSVPVRELDFRSLVGCYVVVIGMTSTERLRAVTDRIIAHAAAATVLTGMQADDLGHVWERGKGWRKFGDGPAREVV